MKNILVVDDERLIRYSLSAAFRDKHTDTVACERGIEALDMIRKRRFDFCFLDIQLPDMSGLDVLRSIREISPDTRVIIMTGSEVDEPALRTIQENAFFFLTKPFDLFRVKRVLDSVSSRHENVFHEFSRLEARLESERRKTRREPAVARQVTYVADPGTGEPKQLFPADLIDISDSGTCIRTTGRLEPGSRIRFKNSINDAAGIVRWSTKDERNNVSIAGIQFVDFDEE